MAEYPELLRAIWADDPEAVKAIIERGVDVDILDPDGRTALMECAGREDKFEYLCLLIDAGANVNASDIEGWTPLHFAAQAQLPKTVEYLLKHGALPDPQDSHGNTPLFRAVSTSRGRGDVITLLRNVGADPFIENNNGKSPIDFARMIANFDVFQYFKDIE
jgi:ankyrin repeat protein